LDTVPEKTVKVCAAREKDEGGLFRDFLVEVQTAGEKNTEWDIVCVARQDIRAHGEAGVIAAIINCAGAQVLNGEAPRIPRGEHTFAELDFSECTDV
jgi:hypothetical protein